MKIGVGRGVSSWEEITVRADPFVPWCCRKAVVGIRTLRGYYIFWRCRSDFLDIETRPRITVLSLQLREGEREVVSQLEGLGQVALDTRSLRKQSCQLVGDQRLFSKGAKWNEDSSVQGYEKITTISEDLETNTGLVGFD